MQYIGPGEGAVRPAEGPTGPAGLAGIGQRVCPGARGITLGAVGFRPGSLEGVQTSPTGGQVEYLLARNAVIREFRKGRLSRLDVCDAHPELLRAARNLGRPTGERCPICEEVGPGRRDLRLRLAPSLRAAAAWPPRPS